MGVGALLPLPMPENLKLKREEGRRVGLEEEGSGGLLNMANSAGEEGRDRREGVVGVQGASEVPMGVRAVCFTLAIRVRRTGEDSQDTSSV